MFLAETSLVKNDHQISTPVYHKITQKLITKEAMSFIALLFI